MALGQGGQEQRDVLLTLLVSLQGSSVAWTLKALALLS